MDSFYIRSCINHRRKQILVHSYIYYVMGQEVISDKQWDTWARELVQLQREHPTIAETAIEAWQFRDFDATTGFHFEYPDWVEGTAIQVVEYDRRDC